MSNSILWVLAVVLAYPLQVLVLVVVQLGNDTENLSPIPRLGAFVCSNYIHGTTTYRCSFGRLVSNAAEGAFIMDLFSAGLLFIPAVLAMALLLMGMRALHRKWVVRHDHQYGGSA